MRTCIAALRGPSRKLDYWHLLISQTSQTVVWAPGSVRNSELKWKSSRGWYLLFSFGWSHTCVHRTHMCIHHTHLYTQSQPNITNILNCCVCMNMMTLMMLFPSSNIWNKVHFDHCKMSPLIPPAHDWHIITNIFFPTYLYYRSRLLKLSVNVGASQQGGQK